MRKRAGDGQLHLHAAGKFLDGLALRQVKLLEERLVLFCIPGFINAAQNATHLLSCERFGKTAVVHDNADALLKSCVNVIAAFPKQGEVPFIPVNQPEQKLDCRRFASTVFANQPHDTAAGQGEADMVERKPVIGFRQVPYGNRVVHKSFSFAKKLEHFQKLLLGQAAPPGKRAGLL